MLQDVVEIISQPFSVNCVFHQILTNIEAYFILQPFFFKFKYYWIARLTVLAWNWFQVWIGWTALYLESQEVWYPRGNQICPRVLWYHIYHESMILQYDVLVQILHYDIIVLWYWHCRYDFPNIQQWYHEPVCGMSIRNLTSLGSNLASVTDLKRIQLHTVYTVILEETKPIQLVAQDAEFKFESKFKPLPVIWQSLGRLFQKVIEGLEEKINGQALGAALS